MAYEHYHRYLWAAPLVAGRRVLDLGSGEGYGSAILAGAGAEAVTGMDIDERAVEHARLSYSAPNLHFVRGSALDLSELGPAAFDIVVALEILEHVADQDALLEQVERVLDPAGLLLLSTPDRLVYTEAEGRENPFHEHELTEPELRELLGGRFPHVAMWGQRASSGSRIASLDGAAPDTGSAFSLERSAEEWHEAGAPAPMYLIAVASRTSVDLPPRESALHDHDLELLREGEREITAALEAAEAARAAASAAGAELSTAREELARASAEGERVSAEAERARAEAEGARAELLRLRENRAEALDAELVNLSRQLVAAEARTEAAEAAVAAETARGADVSRRLARVEGSVTWRGLQRARAGLYGPRGERSLRGRALSAALRALGRSEAERGAAERTAGRPEPLPPIRIPHFEHPLASILVPMHSSGAAGERALRSLARNTSGIPFELVVVNDRADEETARVIEALENAEVIVNSENLGFLASTNRAAHAAGGRYLVLLNDDTEVQPGWLEALVDCADSDPRIAYVAAKLVHPDGRLQEAGSIVWQDATGWNFGRGDSADLPQYNYRRDVDYGSAAAALVRADAWNEAGGFDDRFGPGYYEDTDLCFALRDRGHRVVYEPRAVVVHHEGVSHGNAADDPRGKRHQELNRPKFVAKWRATLEAGHRPPPPASDPRVAADRNPGEHVLVIDHRVPMPDSDSGSLRMFELLRALRERGCRVTFLPDNLGAQQPYTSWMQSFGVEVLHDPLDVPAELDALRGRVSLAIVSRPQIAARYLDALRERIPGARVAYDTVDLHYVREQRRAELGEGNPAKAVALREIELALIRACDTTIVVTEPERAEVLSAVPDADVRVIPNANDVAEVVPPPDGREGLLFVGGFQHTPNLDAAIVLVREIMPLVWRELPECVLTIVGPHRPPEIDALASARVRVAGWVPDMTELLEGSRLMVAPLRYGAGMKGKVTQSLAAGLPVVTTTVGAEGLAIEPGEHMLVADHVDQIAADVIRLYRDDELWRRLSAAGQRAAEAGWSRPAMRACVDELVEAAAAQPGGGARSSTT
ncbi:MAG: hypothetical protein QOE06_2646 [Thermoleophilaceae bacterium]|nr:hypothetical protein [Thermoleophilaceae bacterium]